MMIRFSHKTDWICTSVTLSDTFIGFMQHVGMCNKHEMGSFGKLSKMLLCLLACVCILLLVLLYMPIMIHYMLTLISLHEVSWYKGVSIQTVPGILIWQIFLLDLDYWSVHRASFILFFNHLFFLSSSYQNFMFILKRLLQKHHFIFSLFFVIWLQTKLSCNFLPLNSCQKLSQNLCAEILIHMIYSFFQNV